MLGKEGKCRQLIRTITGQTLLDQISNSVLRRWTDVEDIEEHFRKASSKMVGTSRENDCGEFDKKILSKDNSRVNSRTEENLGDVKHDMGKKKLDY